MTSILKPQVDQETDVFDNALKYKIINFHSLKACGIAENKIYQYVNDSNTYENWRLIKLKDGTYEIMSEHTNDICRGRCFTWYDDKPVDLQAWRFVNNNHQRWNIEKIEDSDDLYKIRATTVDLVLTVKDCSSANGAAIVTEKATGTLRECQKWKIEKA